MEGHVDRENLLVTTGRIKALEPLVLTRSRGAGGYVETLKYIPSTTIRGAIVSVLGQAANIEHLTYEELEKYGYSPIITTAGFPVKTLDEINNTTPLRLPLRSIAMSGENTYLSTALLWAKYYISSDRSLLEKLTSLNYKVGYVFWLYRNGVIDKYVPETLVYTHVALDYEKRTAAEKYLYTVEALKPGTSFGFKLLTNRNVWKTLSSMVNESRQEDEVVFRTKIGSQKSRGYGLVEFKLDKPISYNEYLKKRKDTLRLIDNGLIVVDVLSGTPIDHFTKLFNNDNIIYARYKLSMTKRYYEREKGRPKFIISQIIEPGSVFVIQVKESSIDKFLELEFPMSIPHEYPNPYTPTFFINNPIHLVEV